MRWSSTEMSSNSPARRIFRVISISAWLGWRLPEGWLCATMMPQARALSAAAKMILTSTTVPDVPPREARKRPVTWLARLRKKDEEFFEQFDVVAPIRAQDVFRIAGGMDAGAICGLQLAAVGNGDFGYLPEPCVFHKLDFYDLKMPPLRGRAGEPRPHLDLLPVGALVGEDFLPFCVGKRPQEPWRASARGRRLFFGRNIRSAEPKNGRRNL
jgi:hypothetical protein